MKFILKFSVLYLVLSGCSNDREIIEKLKPQQTYNLGITQNNMYPNWPDTYRMGLSDNEWINWKRGDTLVVQKRVNVSDDSGDDIYYTFLVKPNDHIRPLRIKWTSNDRYANPPRNNVVIIDVPIQNFRLQNYVENKFLACETSLPMYYNGINYAMIDRMWVYLD